MPGRRPKVGGESRLAVTLFVRANQRAAKAPRAGDLGLLRRPSGGGKWDARGACRQGATAAGLVHSQARRRAVGEITGLPTQSRSGDGSSGITATTGIYVWRARRRVGMPALMGRGGELCGHGLPRGSAIGHRALHGCCGIAGRAGRACLARTAAGPCPFVLCLNQLQICLNRARPVELRLARWLDMGGGMSGAHRKPTGGTPLQVPGPSVHCGPMVPHPGGGEQKHGDGHRLGAVMGVLSHYLHWRQGAGTHPPEAHFAPGGRAARACGY